MLACDRKVNFTAFDKLNTKLTEEKQLARIQNLFPFLDIPKELINSELLILMQQFKERGINFSLETEEKRIEPIRAKEVEENLNKLKKETDDQLPYICIIREIDNDRYLTYELEFLGYKSIFRYDPTTPEALINHLFLIIPEIVYSARLKTMINQGTQNLAKEIEEIQLDIVREQIIYDLVHNEQIIICLPQELKIILSKINFLRTDKKEETILTDEEEQQYVFQHGNLPVGIQIKNGLIYPLQSKTDSLTAFYPYKNEKDLNSFLTLIQEVKDKDLAPQNPTSPRIARQYLKNYLNDIDYRLMKFKTSKKLFKHSILGGLVQARVFGLVTTQFNEEIAYWDFSAYYPQIAQILGYNSLIKLAYNNELYKVVKEVKPTKEIIKSYLNYSKVITERPLRKEEIREIQGFIELKHKKKEEIYNLPIAEFIRLGKVQPSLLKKFKVTKILKLEVQKEDQSFLNIQNLSDKSKKTISNTIIGITRKLSPFLFTCITSTGRLLTENLISSIKGIPLLILTDGVIVKQKLNYSPPTFPISFKKSLKGNMAYIANNSSFTIWENEKIHAWNNKIKGKENLWFITAKEERERYLAQKTSKLSTQHLPKGMKLKKKYETFCTLKSNIRALKTFKGKLIYPIMLMKNLEIPTDGLDQYIHAPVIKYKQTADLIANFSSYIHKTLENLAKVATEELIRTRTDLKQIQENQEEIRNLSPEKLPTPIRRGYVTVPLKIIPLVNPSALLAEKEIVETLKELLAHKTFLSKLLDDCFVKSNFGEYYQVNHSAYQIFLKYFLRNAWIVFTNEKHYFPLDPEETDLIIRKADSLGSFAVFITRPGLDKNSSLRVNCFTGREFTLKASFYMNIRSNRGINANILTLKPLNIHNSTLGLEIFKVLLEKNREKLQIFSQSNPTNKEESHSRLEIAKKVFGSVLAQKALEYAIEHHAITQIEHCSITIDCEEFEKNILTIITRRIKNYQENNIKNFSLVKKVEHKQKIPIHEHLESEGYSLGQTRKFVFTTYNKNEKWRTNKLARMMKYSKMPLEYLSTLKIPKAPNKTRIEFTMWGVRRFYSTDPTLANELAEKVKNYAIGLKEEANEVKEIFEPSEFEKYLFKTLPFEEEEENEEELDESNPIFLFYDKPPPENG